MSVVAALLRNQTHMRLVSLPLLALAALGFASSARAACRPITMRGFRPVCGVDSPAVVGYDACLAACVADASCEAFVDKPECRLVADARRCKYEFSIDSFIYALPENCRGVRV